MLAALAQGGDAAEYIINNDYEVNYIGLEHTLRPIDDAPGITNSVCTSNN
jgi:hypothetical protein